MVKKKEESLPDTPAYQPIGDIISMGSAFVQATAALDLAAKYAQDSKDTAAMLQVAALWIEMGSQLNSPSPEGEEEDEEEAELESETSPPIGFGPGTPKEIGAKNGKR